MKLHIHSQTSNNGTTVEAWELIGNFIPYFTGHVIAVSFWDSGSKVRVGGGGGVGGWWWWGCGWVGGWWWGWVAGWWWWWWWWWSGGWWWGEWSGGGSGGGASYDRLIFNMGIPYLGKTIFILRRALVSWLLSSPDHQYTDYVACG